MRLTAAFRHNHAENAPFYLLRADGDKYPCTTHRESFHQDASASEKESKKDGTGIPGACHERMCGMQGHQAMDVT